MNYVSSDSMHEILDISLFFDFFFGNIFTFIDKSIKFRIQEHLRMYEVSIPFKTVWTNLAETPVCSV